MASGNFITGIILSGGKSRRMGRDKGLIRFKGKLLIHYATDLMHELADEIIISTNNEDYKKLNYPTVSDNYKDVGPLGGIEAALRHSDNKINLLAPCDNPFLTKELFTLLLSKISGFDAAVPRNIDGKTEPLTACYSKDILPVIVHQIESGDYKVQNFLKKIRTIYVDTNYRFENFNAPGDLKEFR
jgi:molybdopterin-guanine dinucleotide biosynthesis protein A